MRKFVYGSAFVVAVLGWCVSNASAANVSLTPTEDAMIYLGFPTTPMKNAFGGILSNLVAAGFTGTGHDSSGVLRYNTAATGLTSSQVVGATLNLFTLSTEATGFGANPTATETIPLDVFKVGPGFWGENTVSWNGTPANLPLSSVANTGSNPINAVGAWFTIDVTTLVKDWLDTPAGNNGLRLSHLGPRVENDSEVGVAAVFASGGANAAFINIEFAEVAVPEPSTFALAAIAAVALGGMVYRQHRRKVVCQA
ncbi:MAG: DNRLRE domain-containing protein [Planctomycetes bacterium]|nr:DNRLRE domain-containing protein [Planctomycetota bacterium]